MFANKKIIKYFIVDIVLLILNFIPIFKYSIVIDHPNNIKTTFYSLFSFCISGPAHNSVWYIVIESIFLLLSVVACAMILKNAKRENYNFKAEIVLSIIQYCLYIPLLYFAIFIY